MSKIINKIRFFNLPDVPELADIGLIRIYYVRAPGPIVDGEKNALASIPYIDIPYIAGTLRYGVNLPAEVPITEGEWMLGVASVDKQGNTSDVDVLSSFFDFTVPPAPKWEV